MNADTGIKIYHSEHIKNYLKAISCLVIKTSSKYYWQ